MCKIHTIIYWNFDGFFSIGGYFFVPILRTNAILGQFIGDHNVNFFIFPQTIWKTKYMNREKPQWRGKKKEKEKLEKEVWYLSFLFFTSLFLQSMVSIFSNFYTLFSVSIFTFFLIYIYFFCSRFSWFEWLWFQSFNFFTFLQLKSITHSFDSSWNFFSKIFPALIIATESLFPFLSWYFENLHFFSFLSFSFSSVDLPWN